MRNPLLDLREILNKVTVQKKIGKVLQVDGSVLVVSVNSGSIRVKNTTATNYKVGDSVSVQGDVLLGRAGSGLQPRVYRV